MIFLFTISLFIFSSTPNLIVEISPKEKQVLKISDLEKLIPSQILTVYEPQENKRRSYRGIPTLDLLKKIFGNKLDSFDKLVLHCEDGYRSDISLREFIEKKSLLAYENSNRSQPFELKGKNGTISLSPFYLVWNHPNASAATKDIYRWPYAITRIQLINSTQEYASLVKKTSGYTHFMNHCFSCHSVNNVGGMRGPPLNYFFTTQPREKLIAYILDPKKQNPNSQMSGLSAQLPQREKVAQEIIDYGQKVAQPLKAQ